MSSLREEHQKCQYYIIVTQKSFATMGAPNWPVMSIENNLKAEYLKKYRWPTIIFEILDFLWPISQPMEVEPPGGQNWN